jgi:DNA (cytosine-5)-methyltransferase 1
MESFSPYRVIEYFAGIGLVRMGLERDGWSVVFANDHSAKKYALYKGFFPDAADHYQVEDVFRLDPAAIPTGMLATCSFPCIDLSLAGNRTGIHGTHSSAFWGFVRLLEWQETQAPPLLLVENVPGWLTSNQGIDFRLTVQALNRLGYRCDVFIIDALRFTPQSRPRVFLVAARHPALSLTMQAHLSRPAGLTSERLRRALIANDDLDWFYHPLPEPPALYTGGLAGIIETIPENDSRWWSAAEVKRHLTMMTDTHRQRILQFVDTEPGVYRTFYRRIRAGQQRAEVRDDDLAGCLRTAVGGSGKQFLVRAGGGQLQMRAMTPREYARLQGVPDSYPIVVQGVQALTGFGDAVCVPVITWISQQVLKPLTQTLLTSTPLALMEPS